MARRVEPADSLDFFPTPPWATRAYERQATSELMRLNEKAAASAEAAIKLSPINASAIRTIGFQRLEDGDAHSGNRLMELAASLGPVRGVHDVRVRRTPDGEIVNFHCRVDPQLGVQAVQEKVDTLERALRARSPSIKRVIGHAEPIR